MKKNNKKIGIVLVIIIVLSLVFFSKYLLSIALNQCVANLPSSCGIPMPPIVLSNLNENVGWGTVTSLSSINYVNGASAVYFAGSGMNNSVYGYRLQQIVSQPNYYYAGAGSPGGSIEINGNVYHYVNWNIVFPINTTNKTDIENAINYDLNQNNLNQINGITNLNLFNQTETGNLNINLYNSFVSACASNITIINHYAINYNTCIAFNEVVPVPSGASLYTPISTGIEYAETLNYLNALNNTIPSQTTTSTTSTTTSMTTSTTTTPPPPPPPQFNLTNLLNSIVTAINNFIKQYFSV